MYVFMALLLSLLKLKCKVLQKNVPPSECYALISCLLYSKVLINLLILFSFFLFPPILLNAILTSSNAMFCVFVCWWFLFFADCCQAKDQYIEQFKDTLNTSVAKSIAGFFAEPIQVGILTLDINWADF